MFLVFHSGYALSFRSKSDIVDGLIYRDTIYMEKAGYCVKCRQKRKMENAKPTTTSNNRKAMKGQCAVCGTKMMRFVKTG